MVLPTKGFQKAMKHKLFPPLLFWILGIAVYSCLNYFQENPIEISFLMAWTVSLVVYGILVPDNRKNSEAQRENDKADI
jgi:uncharacterized protein (DUF486 family)